MSDDWMTDRIRAGTESSRKLYSGTENPVHVAVELGRTAGQVAIMVYREQGLEAAKVFAKALAEAFNADVLEVDLSQEQLRLFTPCD